MKMRYQSNTGRIIAATTLLPFATWRRVRPPRSSGRDCQRSPFPQTILVSGDKRRFRVYRFEADSGGVTRFASTRRISMHT